MLALTVKAELNGVTDLRPDDSAENPFQYTFKVQCTSCRETHPNWVTLNRFETHDLSGSRGDAHFVWKCKNCKREHSATIMTGPNAYVATETPKVTQVITLDCRGLEFVEFRADGEWLATGVESGTKFEGVLLDEGEWYDYDEKAGEEVSVKDIQWDIKRA